jgi:hypothetical protein
VQAARRAPWSTSLALAAGVGAAVFLISLVNPSTAWRADAREAWSVALLVLFISGGLADLTPPRGAIGAAGAMRRAWALTRPCAFALALALACAAAVTLSDLNLWHTSPHTAFTHALVQAALVALVGPVHALTRQPED